jgi:SPX domain protein involved in polyphosphate accumulation
LILPKEKSRNSKSPLHFARFEFKYLLSASLREEIEKELKFFLQYDPFVADKVEHVYPVRSLYYDDPVFSAFYDKVDGLHSRSKYRIRTYSFEANKQAPVFLEIKGRHNNLVYKHRVPITSEKNLQWSHLSGDKLTSAVLKQADSSAVRDQFEFDLIRKRLQPVALIDYQRRPYISKFDSSFRITFDANLKVTRTENLFPQQNKIATKQILSGYTVLEVKFQHHMPSWFHRLIQAYELKRISISKICSGMEVLGLAIDTN